MLCTVFVRTTLHICSYQSVICYTPSATKFLDITDSKDSDSLSGNAGVFLQYHQHSQLGSAGGCGFFKTIRDVCNLCAWGTHIRPQCRKHHRFIRGWLDCVIARYLTSIGNRAKVKVLLHSRVITDTGNPTKAVRQVHEDARITWMEASQITPLTYISYHIWQLSIITSRILPVEWRGQWIATTLFKLNWEQQR